MKKPATKIPATTRLRVRPLAMRPETNTPSATTATPNTSENSSCGPPAAQPSGTGLAEISTTARPPKATDPMMPVENNPA